MAALIARSVQKSLTQISPENETYFAKNLQEFERKLDQKIAVWKSVLEPFKDQKLIFYHNSWPYFLRRFGLSAAAFIEPKPGIPPSPAHIAFLLKLIREQNIKVIAMEPFFDPRVPNMLSRETGARVIVLPPSVGTVIETRDYFGLFDYLTRILAESLK